MIWVWLTPPQVSSEHTLAVHFRLYLGFFQAMPMRIVTHRGEPAGLCDWLLGSCVSQRSSTACPSFRLRRSPSRPAAVTCASASGPPPATPRGDREHHPAALAVPLAPGRCCAR